MKNRLFYLLMLLLTMVTQGAWAMGELTGRFSVNETKQVYFSQGNLQAVIASGPTNTYNYTASKWKFAEHQWSYVGNNAGNNSFAAGTTVDLFGWVGTSASNITYGLCTYNDADGTYYGNSTEDALKSDWGTLAIENGGNTANSGWRTLTRGEWDYLFNTRSASTIGSTDNARYAKAKVNNVAGVILFPDRYTHPEGVTPPTSVNTATSKYTANKYSDDAWTQMETAGAVFLPAAGYRNGTSVGRAGEYGLYWSSSPNTSHGIYADHVHFYDNNMYLNGDDRQQGNCVRLVKDVTLTTDNTGAILINCTDDWTIFADDVNKGNTYSDQTVKLTADISGVTMMAGTEEHPFKGTFDGQRHTLTANITSSGAAALFGRVANATILNLHVAGFVTTTMTDGADHTGGLIGKTSGEVTIHDVRVSATVTGHTYYGGFIGNRGNSPMINMMGCVFDGTLTENVAGETQHAGGFIGWGGSSPYIIISYSLFAGTCTIATNGSGAHNFHPVGYYSSYNYEDPPVILTPDLSHVYYTVAPSAQTTVNFGAALSYHEKQAYTISTSDANVTTLDIDDYLGYEFPTSGLNFYITGGIKYGSTFYAGDGDKVELALAHKDAAVGQHFTGYAVTGGGTLDDNTSNTPTLTMTAANQTISAVYADNTSHNVSFVEGTETGWSTAPSGTAREGETVTVSYQGEHKVKSVTVNPQSGDAIQVYMSKTGDTYSGTFTMPTSDVEISTKLYYKLSAEKSWDDNWRLYCLQSDFFLDRTLTKDVWNTFASPFAIPADKMEAYFGAGAKVLKLSSSTIEEGNVLSLNFEKVTEIAAGYPYIVKPTVNVVEPTFADADYYNSNANLVRTTYVNFFATLGLYEMYFYPKEVLVMTIEGKLVHPNPAWDIKGYRGFFTLPQIYNQARAFRINFGDGETTDIDATLVNSEKVNSDVYDLQGRKVTQPKQKGIYIQNGRKAIIK